MIGHHLKNIFDSVGFTYVLIFSKMIVLKYQDPTTEKIFENARRYQSFLGGGGKTFKKKQVPVQILRIHQICISCFLIDMKLKSKLGCCLVMENVSFSILISTKHILLGEIQKYVSKKCGYTFQKFRKFPNFHILRYQK